MFIDLATIIDAKNTATIKNIEVQRLSSPAIPSKRNVAAVPAPTARAILNQNSTLSLRLRSDISADVCFGSSLGVLVDSVGGVGVSDAFSSGVSAGLGFLCLTNEVYQVQLGSFKTLGVAQAPIKTITPHSVCQIWHLQESKLVI